MRFSTWLLLGAATFFSMAFDTDNDETQFYLNTYRTFTPGEEVTVYLNGRFAKSRDLQFDLYRILKPVDFFNAQENVHSPGTRYDSTEEKMVSTINPRDTKMFRASGSWETRVKKERYWRRQEVSVPVQESGVYLLTARLDGKIATTVVIVTPAGLVTKQSSTDVLGYAASNKDGTRLKGARIVFREGDKSVERRTDDNGVAMIASSLLDDPNQEDADEPAFRRRYGRDNVVLYGESGDDFFISDSYYYNYWYGNNQNSRVYIHTDRPVYRPLQTVYFRGILRAIEDDGTYAMPSDDSIQIKIYDARGEEIDLQRTALSYVGTFHGEITLGDEPPLGTYRLDILQGGQHLGQGTFEVLEYKKPEFEVKVSTAQGSYTKGETIDVKVQTDYYFGSPVSEGTVEYRVLRSRYWRPWWEGSRWAYLYSSMPAHSRFGSEYVENGTGKLNEDGSFAFSVKTPSDLEQDYTYTLVVNVTDASRRTTSGSAGVRVTRGAFYLSSRTTRYVYKPGDNVELIVNAQSFGGEEGVATDFTVDVERTWWNDRGRERSEESVWSGSGRTNGAGEGRISFETKKPGYYRMTVKAKDKLGNEIATSNSLYVADRDYPWGDLSDGNVQIIPDKDLYKPGETITALVIMPVGDIDALMTVEGPTIFDHQVERLSGNSALVRIPVEERYAPNIFLSATALVGNQMYTTQQQIMVAPEGSTLTIEITTDKEEYRPGDPGTVTLRALDAEGNPVKNVDLALGMVDEAIYAIRPDNTQPIEAAFYGQRYNAVNTSSSLQFRFWSASVDAPLDAEDVASGAVSVEESLSSGIRGSRAANAKLAYGGNALGGEDLPLVQPTLRSDFRDQMFWSPSVRTDSRGYAKVPVTFPDNLTTWRITARGVTHATQVGESTAKVIARKNLLVRMETPRFITEGDSLLIATNVHNYLDEAKEVTLEFAAEGLEQTNDRTTVRIEANGEARVDWAVRAEKIGDAALTIRALTNEESDAMEMIVPILPQGVLTGSSAITDIAEDRGTRQMSLNLPQGGRLPTALLKINLSPSAASSMIGALDELIGYPYGCVEQTMSRFLPTVVVADVLKNLNVPFDQAKREELPKMVEQGIKRLKTLQHDDGGWGWWENDETNPFMTAYVMYGLTTAMSAGYEISDDMYNAGRGVLYTMIESRTAGGSIGSKEKSLDKTTEAYTLYVASVLHDRGKENGMVKDHIEELASDRKINPYAVALLASAANVQNLKTTTERLAARLRASVDESASGAHWSGQTWHYNWQDDEVETTAAAVKALLAIDGETDLVKKGVRWLLGKKSGSSWHNTRQTAMVIYALVDYLKVSNELTPNFTAIVKVNGREVMRERFTEKDVFADEKSITLKGEMLRPGENVVTIEKEGSGRLYGSARLTYFATGEAMKPGQAGFKVEREYYRLERTEKKGRIMYEKKKIEGPLPSGAEILVKLKVTPENDVEYVMVEDPLPAGCEVITDTDGYEIIGEDAYSYNDGYRYGYYWNYWYADRDVRDEKITFFATQMENRTREMTYIMRAQIPGNYGVMPATAMLMYYPEVRGNSGARDLKIQD